MPTNHIAKNTFLFFSVIFLFSCKKNKEIDNIFFNSKISEKYFFKKGSYWIYKDSISGKIDSFYLDTCYHFKPSLKSEEGPYYESIGITIIEKPNDSFIRDRIEWRLAFNARSQVSAGYSNKNNIREINTLLFNSYHLFEPQETIVDYEYKDNFGSISIIPDYSLEKNVFNSVALINYGEKNSIVGISSYFFNDSVGYIKMKLNYDDGKYKIKEVWELQRWKIIK